MHKPKGFRVGQLLTLSRSLEQLSRGRGSSEAEKQDRVICSWCEGLVKPPVFTCVVAALAVELHPGKVFALTAGPGLQELLEEVLAGAVTCGSPHPLCS